MSSARRFCCSCLALALALASPGAWCEEAPAVVAAEGVDPLQATPTQSEQAQSRFARGKLLFTEGKYREAAEEFQASRAIVASPNARLYRARCLVQLGNLIEAYVEFGRTMVQALELAKQDVRYTHTAEAATQERSEVEQRLAFVRVNVHHARAGTRLFVNGEEIRRQAWGEPVPALPGEGSVELLHADSAPLRRALSLAAGAKVELVLDAGEAQPTARESAERAPPPLNDQRAQDDTSSLRPYAYAAGAVAVAGYAGFAIFGSLSERRYAELQERCLAGVCPAEEQRTIDTGRQQQLLANIGLGVGILATGAAVTLWVLEPRAENMSQTPRLRLAVSPSGVLLRGQL